ncbi:hypothetical protein GCM10020358_43770 [Amorphoplanes nipponensis]|uniref:Uncharacterized protein n=1 Tax=Actinoplanes nipponensis TaxID=135950 RepID=A0A919JLE4_9ACTN|nr:DUF6461 domain-containing protein [Actinoplanes nipponensis]GIE48939.1 hypothetical protein Ani05nite_24730 [Actinoplanes nipponensis]
MDDLAHARALGDELGGTFCLTYLKGVDAPAALRRLGGCPETVRERTGAELTASPRLAAAVRLGAWSVVIEPGGALGADRALLEAASRGAAAVCVSRHAGAAGHFAYAVDGTTVTGFDPAYPAEETVWGSDPGMLRRLMDALGLRPPSDESERTWEDAEARAIVLAQRITGVRLPERPLRTALVSAELEPWFVTPASRGDLLRARRRDPDTAELVAAAETAGAERQRAVAVAEVRRQAAVLGLADTPGLTPALDAGHPIEVGSPLGARVRGWLATVRQGAEHPDRLTEQERAHAAGLGWFLGALRGRSDPDPRVALLAALKPYASGLPGLADGPARAAVLAALRDQAH